MSVPERDPFGAEPPGGEPVFNVPSALVWLLTAMLAAFLITDILPRSAFVEVLLWCSLIPARYGGASELGPTMVFPGGIAADLWTFVTYTFLHGGWGHLIANSVVLLAFGAPVLRRLGVARFFAFYFLCGIVGGLTHVLVYQGSLLPVVGASAAISGLVGGAARFVFLAGGPLGGMGGGAIRRQGAPAARATILQSLTDARTMIFVAVWLGLNVLFGATGLSITGTVANVAWEAHLGGFLAGLLLFGLFDPPAYSPSGGPGNVGYGEWGGGKG